METLLHKIKDFADKAHGDQLRKYSGDRYIVHPVRVMEILKQYDQDDEVLAAALLHDVLEDTPVTKTEILNFLKSHVNEDKAQEILALVIDLTDVFIKENFPSLNRKARKANEVDRLIKVNPRAQTIKYADIIDNSLDIAENDEDFAQVYLREMKQLLLKMDKGHPDLYSKALTTVEQCKDKVKKKA